MRHPLDLALDRNPDFPPGVRWADLDRGYRVDAACRDGSRAHEPRWVWVDVMQLQYMWICLAL